MTSNPSPDSRETILGKLKLGKDTAADDTGLDVVPRALGRSRFEGLVLPFAGYDLWNGYEVSFLDPSGKPRVFHVQLVFEADSLGIVESKSLKLFFNSYNQTVFDSREAFAAEITARLKEALDSRVAVHFYGPNQNPGYRRLEGDPIDHETLTQRPTAYDPNLLRTRDGAGVFSYHSHLLRSNCPVTNQPDWGAVQITGGGNLHPDPASLLTYIVSMREHQDFHEACCETIFMDLTKTLAPDWLSVSCHYTRRGGWDINPARFSKRPNTVNRALVWRQ